MKKKNVNIDIAFTHVFSRKKQTLVAALGVTIGISIFIFMNSLSEGFTKYSRGEIFKNNAHIKVYKEEEISTPINKDENQIIVNPKIIAKSDKIINPFHELKNIQSLPFITHAIAQVNVGVYYHNGSSKLSGTVNGVEIESADQMFNISSYMIAGNLYDIKSNTNGIVIGKGIADKLNVRLYDQINVSSSFGVSKLMKVIGIFSTGNSGVDKVKSYIHIATAQKLAKQNPSYVTTIYANTIDINKTSEYAQEIQTITEYKVEDWKITSADILAGDKVRKTMMGAISLSILLVAAFGIYNILNMTVSQKINDIAILKATGFSSQDVIKIFVTESFIMGFIGTLIGLVVASILVTIMGKMYMGPPVGYFPISFEPQIFTMSFILGIVITIFAGYFPAKKASRVDPVEIFRK